MWLHYTHCWRSSLSLVSIGHWPETIVLYPNASVSSCLTLWPLLHLPIAISLTCLSCSVLALCLNAWPPLHTDSETGKIGYWYWRCCNRSIRLVFSPACWASPHLLWCNLVLLYEGALNLVRYCIAWTLLWTLFATSLLYARYMPNPSPVGYLLAPPRPVCNTTLTTQGIIPTHRVHPLCLALASAVAIGDCCYTRYTLNMLPSMPLAVWVSGLS